MERASPEPLRIGYAKLFSAFWRSWRPYKVTGSHAATYMVNAGARIARSLAANYLFFNAENEPFRHGLLAKLGGQSLTSLYDRLPEDAPAVKQQALDNLFGLPRRFYPGGLSNLLNEARHVIEDPR
jgi:hypothetical protein